MVVVELSVMMCVCGGVGGRGGGGGGGGGVISYQGCPPFREATLREVCEHKKRYLSVKMFF